MTSEELKSFADSKTQELIDEVRSVNKKFFADNKDIDGKILMLVWARAMNYLALAPFTYNAEIVENGIKAWTSK